MSSTRSDLANTIRNRLIADGFLREWVSRALLGGLIFSMALVFVSGLLVIGTGGSLPNRVLPVGNLLPQMAILDPEAWLDSGIAVLLVTPVLSLLCSLLAFLRHRDWLYVLVTVIVLSILATSAVLSSR